MSNSIPAVIGGTNPEVPQGKDSFRARTFWTEHNGPIIPFKDVWPNETGYMNGVVNDTSIWNDIKGGLCRSIDPSGRRMLIAQTPFGNICVFERKPQALDADPVVWVSNTPLEISRSGLLPSGAVSEQSMHIFFKEYASGRTCYQTMVREILERSNA